MRAGSRIWYAITAATAVSTTLATGVIGSAGAASADTATRGSAAVVLVTPQQLQPWPVLRQGRNSLWPPVTVRSLQYLLNARGARLRVDGRFGATTKAAVIAFQRAHKLTATGVVNGRTWRALIITVRRGSRGPAVRAVQDQINFRNNMNGHTLNVDGIFGLKTEAAVRAFQKAMAAGIPGFVVDGVVRAQTWQALVTEALSG